MCVHSGRRAVVGGGLCAAGGVARVYALVSEDVPDGGRVTAEVFGDLGAAELLVFVQTTDQCGAVRAGAGCAPLGAGAGQDGLDGRGVDAVPVDAVSLAAVGLAVGHEARLLLGVPAAASDAPLRSTGWDL